VEERLEFDRVDLLLAQRAGDRPEAEPVRPGREVGGSESEPTESGHACGPDPLTDVPRTHLASVARARRTRGGPERGEQRGREHAGAAYSRSPASRITGSRTSSYCAIPSRKAPQ